MNAQTSPLPAKITNSAIWVCHKNKQPINPNSRYGAKSNDPSTWATYQEALDAQRMYNLDGIGIQFGLKASDNFGLSGIDLLSYFLFWTNRDVDKTCALFAKSGLMRPSPH